MLLGGEKRFEHYVNDVGWICSVTVILYACLTMSAFPDIGMTP